jgi:hypothetical protein
MYRISGRTEVLLAGILVVVAGANRSFGQAPASTAIEHRVLATNRTSTMERELNEAAAAGFRLSAVMGGDTAFGGSEVVVVMARTGQENRYAYRLLAANRTGTMQRELQQAADSGFDYRGQTVFDSAFGGEEVVAILERDNQVAPAPYEYRLIATARTATLQKELQEAGAAGYQVVGMTVGRTAVGGKELVAITRRSRVP